MRSPRLLTGLATATSLSSTRNSRSSRVRLIALASRTLVIAAALGACGGDSSTAPIAVATVELSPLSNTIGLTQTVQLTATVRDASGNVLTGRAITWSQGNASIATVGSSGLVSAVTPGTTVISATSEGHSGASSITVSPPAITVVVTNQLVDVITVSVNGTPVGTVPASSTAQTTVNVTGSLTISYTLTRPTTNLGTPMGEAMSGVYPTISNPSGTYTATVNNLLGTQQYFSPLISNTGVYPILMAVNWGLVTENRCNCTISSGGSNVNIGYYRLFTNSEVRGYGNISGYGVGAYVFWNYTGFSSLVQSGSGAVLLSNNLSLSNLSPTNTSGIAGSFARHIGTILDSPSRRAGTSLGQAFPNTQ